MKRIAAIAELSIAELKKHDNYADHFYRILGLMEKRKKVCDKNVFFSSERIHFPNYGELAIDLIELLP